MSLFTRLTSAIFVTSLAACAGTATSEKVQPLPQGISGIVTKSVGDFMCCPITGKTYPLSVPVHIFRGRVPFAAEPPQLKALDLAITVHSDDDGRFGAGLPPGTYTAFAEIDGALYLNCSDELYPTAYFCWQDVEPGHFTEIELNDNSQSSA